MRITTEIRKIGARAMKGRNLLAPYMVRDAYYFDTNTKYFLLLDFSEVSYAS
jgi:hypothetical protein